MGHIEPAHRSVISVPERDTQPDGPASGHVAQGTGESDYFVNYIAHPVIPLLKKQL